MKINLITILIPTLSCLFLTFSGTAHGNKVDPFFKINRELQHHDNTFVQKNIGDSEMVRTIIKTEDVDFTLEEIRQSGGDVRSIVGNIITAIIPPSKLNAIGALKEIKYVEASKPMNFFNDLADADTDVNSVITGSGLEAAYEGSGVIIGVIDSGIDITHPDFQDENGDRRILYIWDQTDDMGPGPSEIESTYGTEYDTTAIAEGIVSQVDTVGHGTHVTGTAAGRDDTYPGVASEASIIMVKTNGESAELIDAANYIFQKSAALEMPAAINMSLGTEIGAHDGTSLLEQGLDTLLDSQSGRAIIAAAGNSGQLTGGRHANLDIDVSNMAAIRLDGSSASYSVIDIWGSQDCDVDLTAIIPGEGDIAALIAGSTWVSQGESVGGTFVDSGIEIEFDRTETVNAENGKWQSLIGIAPVYGYVFDIVFRANSSSCTSLDVWIHDNTAASYFEGIDETIDDVVYHPGDNLSTVALPATATNVIAVAAYTTRTKWIAGGVEMEPYTDIALDDLAFFSSRGPAISSSQGEKPTLAAPGAFLISAFSKDTESVTPGMLMDDGIHIAMAGTSMASPHVAGIVATMLEASPELSYADIMLYLKATSRIDSYVGSIPNDDWGYGKIDALSAVWASQNGSIDFDSIALIGIPDGADDVPADMHSLIVHFPSPTSSATLTSNNLFAVPITVTQVGLSISDDELKSYDVNCNASEALSGTISTAGSDTSIVALHLDDLLGFGSFAVCISDDLLDENDSSFGATSINFTTTGMGGAWDNDYGGCSLIKDSKRVNLPLYIIFLFIMMFIPSMHILRKRFMMFAMLALSSIILFPTSAFAEEAKTLQQLIQSCREEKEQKALDACEQAVEMMPGDTPAPLKAEMFRIRGVIYGELGLPEAAIPEFNAAINVWHNDAKSYYNKGVALEDLGFDLRAFEAYRKATELSPGMVEAWGSRGFTAFALNEKHESATSYQKALELDPSYFDKHPDEREIYSESLPSFKLSEEEEVKKREWAVRFTPNVGWLGKVTSSFDANPLASASLDQFIYILMQPSFEVNLQGPLFATGSFTYARTTGTGHVIQNGIDRNVDGALNIIGITGGVQYANTDLNMNDKRVRLWVSGEVGPYITNSSSSIVAGNWIMSGSRTTVSFGMNGGLGFDYQITDNIDIGISAKVHYVLCDWDDYILIGGGPTFRWNF
ncbi:MAG: S8 family serine peptidase [Deltaproteobacteria bacterium]|jgi:subtilisin family serine protease|nr:S8 family serine peptidase [Deltaproteobacteria bacterium]